MSDTGYISPYSDIVNRCSPGRGYGVFGAAAGASAFPLAPLGLDPSVLVNTAVCLRRPQAEVGGSPLLGEDDPRSGQIWTRCERYNPEGGTLLPALAKNNGAPYST